jgi:hypothetical protein
LKDFFNLRCVNTTLRDYIDNELIYIKRIDLPGIKEDISESFRVLSDKCVNLKYLNLSRSNWITNDLILPLLEQNTESLIGINLSYCGNLSSKALHPVYTFCKNLRNLNLSNCYFLTSGSLETLIFHHSKIEELDLSNCNLLTERCLMIMLQKFTHLRVLNLASISSISDNVLFVISKFQKEIVHLNLFNCKNITNRGIGALSLNCDKLETLSIRGCHLLTDLSLDLLRKRNVHLDIPKHSLNAFMNRFNQFDRRDIVYLQV